jgi:putative ABC transport system permease protein
MMKQDPASTHHASTTRGMLVAAQLALSLVLLVGAGLMVRAFISMRSMPLGFDPSRAMTMNVHLQKQRFNDGSLDDAKAKRLTFYHELAESARKIPGVEQVGIGLFVPLSGGPLPQRFSTGPDQPEYPAAGAIALADFLESLRVPLLGGRYFTIEDDDRPVIIVDRQLADQMWPHESALGRRLLLRSTTQEVWVEVVGLVAHVQLQGVRSPGLPEIFMTYAAKQYSDLNIVVRAPNPMALVPAVESAVSRLGSGRPVHDVRLLDDYVADASADTRFALFVLVAFALLAVILTAVGVYGVARLCDGAAHPRNRAAAGARRGPRADRLAGGPRGAGLDDRRFGGRRSGGPGSDAVPAAAALPRHRRRRTDLHRRRLGVGPRGARRDRPAGDPRRAGRSDACPAIRVNATIARLVNS